MVNNIERLEGLIDEMCSMTTFTKKEFQPLKGAIDTMKLHKDLIEWLKRQEKLHSEWYQHSRDIKDKGRADAFGKVIDYMRKF